MMLTRVITRLAALLSWRRRSSELDDEIQFHLSEEADDRAAAGLAPDRARLAARRDFGNIGQVRESIREGWGWGGIERLRQDTRCALRRMRRHPGYSIVVVFTLALGIGANTAIFSLINGLLLRPLPVAHPEQLVLVTDSSSSDRAPYVWTHPMWDQIRRRPQLFDGAFAYAHSRFNLAAGGQTEWVDGLWATAGLLETLGISPALGRAFLEGDDERGGGAAGPVAVISHGLWRDRFGGAADVLGRTLSVERTPFTIVGVLPSEFVSPDAGRPLDIVLPLGMASIVKGPAFIDHAGVYWLTILARLRPGQTLEAASVAIRGVQPQIRQASLPPGPSSRQDAYLKDPLTLVPAGRGNPLAQPRARAERPLLAMQVTVGLILLIACGNIANLTLARGIARRREMGLRLALGASQWNLTRQLFAESLVLAISGAAAGLLLAQWATPVLVQFFSTDRFPLAMNVAPDARVLAFTAGIALLSSVLFGILPALRASRVDPLDFLRSHDGSAAGRRLHLASGFLVAQVGLSLVVVLAGGLLVRTYTNLATKDLGFESQGVLTVYVETRNAQVPPPNRLVVFEEARRAAAAVPGVVGAALADLTPVTGAAMAGAVEVLGAPASRGRETFVNRVSPGWLSAVYQTRLVSGRDFAETDRAGSRRVAIVNQAFVREFLAGADPLGRVVRQMQGPPGRPPMESEVVGVTVDAVYESLRAAVPPTMYLAFDQIDETLLAAGAAPESAALSVRAAGSTPRGLTRDVAAAIATVNPNLDLTFRGMSDVVNQSIALERTLAILSGSFGVLSLLLAAVGLYGATAYAVGRRRTELGVRMALGATPGLMVRQVLSRVLVVLGIGLALGAGASVWTLQLLESLLYGLEPSDPRTWAMAVSALAVTGVLAGWLPARRATRVDPMLALRCD